MEAVFLIVFLSPVVLFAVILVSVLVEELGVEQDTTRPDRNKKKHVSSKKQVTCKHEYDMEVILTPGNPLHTYYKCNKCGDVVSTSEEALYKMGLMT